ncbi:MAG: histidine kinase [Pseudomonadota bacterium]
MKTGTEPIKRRWRLTPPGVHPRTFWFFQLVLWASVYVWRTAYTLAYGFGWQGAHMRAISLSAAIAITLLLAHFIARVVPGRIRLGWLAVILILTMGLGFLHTAADRVLYATWRNDWQWALPPREEYYQILSVNAWVFLSWTAFFLALLQFSRIQDREIAIRNLKETANDARLQMLVQQLNPHFLFNTLNSLSTLIADGRGTDANRMILQLSRFLRQAIDTEHAERTSLGQEVRAVRDYLGIQAVRFGDRLAFEITTPPECEGCLVPALILQPLVENACRHAMTEPPTILNIEVSARCENGRLTLTVSDDGPGYSPSALGGAGRGLALIRERLDLHYGSQASLMLSNGPSGGAMAVITLPDEPLARNEEREVA